MDTITDHTISPLPTLHVQGIDAEHLDQVRSAGADGHGNAVSRFAAAGEGEPLRCCLRYAQPGEAIVLISYAPLPGPSVWREVGPVYVHADACTGYLTTDSLPDELATGPSLLRTYSPDGTMDYEHNTLITERVELEPILRRLLSEPDVETVHVRTAVPQCFLYEVTADAQ